MTVEMCKSNARNDYVKTVIAATTFTEPKEVLAKFVVESTSEKDKKEAQILNFSSNRGRNGHGRGRDRTQNGNFRQNNNFNNGQQQNRRNYNNNGQYRNNWYNNGRGYGNGRGRGRGGHPPNDNNRYVRVMTPGNEQNPSAEGNVLTLQQVSQQ